MNKELIWFVIEGKFKVDQLIICEVLEATAGRYYDVAHWRIGQKRTIVMIFLTTSKFGVNNIEFILKKELIENELDLEWL